jgi:hypothetical protein
LAILSIVAGPGHNYLRWTMRLNAAMSAAIGPAVSAAPRPVELLGVTDLAIYLRLPEAAQPDTVVAVLTNDAVRLPCGLVLGFSSAERSLRRIGPLPADPVMVGNGCIQWTSRLGLIVIHAVRSWAVPVVPAAGTGWPVGFGQLRTMVEDLDIGIDPRLGADLTLAVGEASAETQAVLALLGRGPGLTPSGDDLLAGLLIGARAFGIEIDGVEEAVRAHAVTRTTALSGQLLRNALAGEAIREVVVLIAALTDGVALATALGALLRIGHTSGAALAHGLVLAGQLALAPAGGGR